MSDTHVLVDDRGTAPLRWRYRVQDARTRQTWLGSCRTRDEAMACADAYLRGLWRAKDAIRAQVMRKAGNSLGGKTAMAHDDLLRVLKGIHPEPQPPSP